MEITSLLEFCGQRNAAHYILTQTCYEGCTCATCGGSVTDALAIYDTVNALRAAGVEVNTVAIGNCYSAGVILLQSGTQRLITPNTYLLIHEIAAWNWGKVSEQEDATKHLKALQERVFKVLTERSKVTVRQLKARSYRRDF